MNKEVLAHHTKLHNWFEIDKLSKSDVFQECDFKKGTKEKHINPIKAHEINSWRTEVNKIYQPHTIKKPKQTQHCAVREKDGTDAKTKRIKSAPNLDRTLKVGIYNDFHTLEERINNISIHYNSERKTLPKIEISKAESADVNSETVSDSISLHVDGETNSESAGEENLKDEIIYNETEVPSNSNHLRVFYHKNTPMVSVRSVSNDILNCLTVDDCRIAARYKPRGNIDSKYSIAQIKESRKNSDGSNVSSHVQMKISNGSDFTTLSSLKEEDRLFRQALARRDHRNQLKSQNRQRKDHGNHLDSPLPRAKNDEFCHPASDDKDRRLLQKGGPMYRKLNSALHRKMYGLVKARKEGFLDRSQNRAS